MRFGFDTKSISQARSLGAPVSYSNTWAGSWNQKYGWGDIEKELQQARAAGVTPVVPWWYWGDDISPSCVDNGCVDRYQGVEKDRATWTRLSNELADVMARDGGPGAVVVIEPEFNKNGIETYGAFDGYLADQAAIFHQRGVQVVIGFGNWAQQYWRNFSRAVAAADMLGTMSLQSSVRDASTYLSGASQLLGAAQYYQSTFGKQTLIYDVGFSSYPEPGYEANQDTVVGDIFKRMPEFKAAGVQGLIWRMLADDPNFDTSNYHGIAERYWGVLHSDGSAKEAFRWFTGTSIALSASAGALPPPLVAPPQSMYSIR
jgi:hypothetical protein